MFLSVPFPLWKDQPAWTSTPRDFSREAAAAAGVDNDLAQSDELGCPRHFGLRRH
jgi:hypothetical protein